MKAWLAAAVALAISAGAHGASTLRELLIKAQANPKSEVEAVIEDHLVAQMRAVQPGLQMFARAWRLRPLAEPGCGRFALELSVATASHAKTAVATVEIDLCDGGLPPNPMRLARPPR